MLKAKVSASPVLVTCVNLGQDKILFVKLGNLRKEVLLLLPVLVYRSRPSERALFSCQRMLSSIHLCFC